MSNTTIVLKDEDHQMPVPFIWRNTFFEIVEAWKDDDFILAQGVADVCPISQEDAVRIAENIESYGARLTRLSDESWQTSVCRWMGSYWYVLIDLFTIEEGASDLVLMARVYEEGSRYRFEIHSVHVP